MTLQVAGESFEETHDVLRLAAKLRAQLRLLRRDAGGTGVEVALPRHVAAESDQHRGAEGVFVGAQHRGDQRHRAPSAGRRRSAGARGRADRSWNSTCCASARPSSQGLPAYLMLESGDAPVPPLWPAMTM